MRSRHSRTEGRDHARTPSRALPRPPGRAYEPARPSPCARPTVAAAEGTREVDPVHSNGGRARPGDRVQRDEDGAHGRIRGRRGAAGTGQRAGARLRARQRGARGARRRARRAARRGRPSSSPGHRRGSSAPGGGDAVDVLEPHRTEHVLGTLREATPPGRERRRRRRRSRAAPAWRATSFRDRAAVFLRAADLLAGPWRARFAAATMLGQSKSVYQSEIDAVCELCDFLPFRGRRRRRAVRPPAARLAARRVEPDRPPPARGLRPRHLAVQLHLDRRRTCCARPCSWATPSCGSRARPSSSPRR